MMVIPRQVELALLQILSESLLRIRASGWNEHPEICSIEADHVHNLPGLLRSFSIGGLKYYWKASRESYLRERDASDLAGFEHPWAVIEHYLEKHHLEE